MKSKIIKLIVGLTFVFALKLNAQNYVLGPTVSYQYQKGSTLKAGAYFLTPISSFVNLKTDATANFNWTQNKFAVIPEVALSFYANERIAGFFARAEVTPYTVTPKVGYTLLTLIDLDLGYGLPIQDKKNYSPIKGFTSSIRFNFPLNFFL